VSAARDASQHDRARLDAGERESARATLDASTRVGVGAHVRAATGGDGGALDPHPATNRMVVSVTSVARAVRLRFADPSRIGLGDSIEIR